MIPSSARGLMIRWFAEASVATERSGRLETRRAGDASTLAISVLVVPGVSERRRAGADGM